MASILLVGLIDPDRRNVKAALEGDGHAVAEAATDQFLLAVDRNQFDLVLIDVSPLQHNVHLIGIMELRRRRPTLPILAIGGGRDARMILDFAVKAGANATLRKPFTKGHLLSRVADCLARPAP